MGVVVPKLGLLRVGEDLSYSAIMAMLEPVERQLQRKVNPTLYSPAEFAERLAAGQNFLSKVISRLRYLSVDFKIFLSYYFVVKASRTSASACSNSLSCSHRK